MVNEIVKKLCGGCLNDTLVQLGEMEDGETENGGQACTMSGHVSIQRGTVLHPEEWQTGQWQTEQWHPEEWQNAQKFVHVYSQSAP